MLDFFYNLIYEQDKLCAEIAKDILNHAAQLDILVTN